MLYIGGILGSLKYEYFQIVSLIFGDDIAMSKKHFGKCALCGKETDLTFEHIPPKKALNSQRTKIYTGDESFSLLIGKDGREPWDTDGLYYINQQSGMGTYSLCSCCNSYTGASYGQEYINFAVGVHGTMKELNAVPNTAVEIKDIEFYPLRFFKQVISMFLSINKESFDDSLRRFVLDKDLMIFNKRKYKVLMYFVCAGVQKLVPFTAMIKIGNGCPAMIGCSEITTYPLGFVLLVDPPENYNIKCTDITEFCDCSYNQRYKYDICVPIYEQHTISIRFSFKR